MCDVYLVRPEHFRDRYKALLECLNDMPARVVCGDFAEGGLINPPEDA